MKNGHFGPLNVSLVKKRHVFFSEHPYLEHPLYSGFCPSGCLCVVHIHVDVLLVYMCVVVYVCDHVM